MEVDEIAGVSVHLLADGRRALVHVEIMDDAVARKIADALTRDEAAPVSTIGSLEQLK